MSRQPKCSHGKNHYKIPKKRLLPVLLKLAFLVFALITTVTVGTYAYLSINTSPLANDFGVGIPEVLVEEPSVDPDHVQWGATSKPVFLSVPSDAAGGVVRAAIIPIFKDQSGNIVPSPAAEITQPVSDAMILGDITLHFQDGWESNWFLKDGIFYYKQVLQSGTSTSQLLTGVTLTENSPEMLAKYQNITVEIEVMADILQPTNAALESWSVSVNDSGVVSPR